MAIKNMAQRIKDLRKAKGLTLEQVADIVGVGKSTVRKWETGMIANMKRDKIAALAKALSTTPAYLMGWNEEESEFPVEQKPAENGEPLSETMIIYHRDGKTVKREFTKDQMDMLIKMIEAIPEKPKNI